MKKIAFLFICFNFYLFSQENQVWMHPNRGQWHDNINYKINLSNGEFLIEQNAFMYVFHNVAELRHHHDSNEKHDLSENSTFKQHAIKTSFIGSNPNHRKIEKNKSSFYKNYFLGNDKSKWKSDVYSFSDITYPDFYQGIDLQLEGKYSEMKYSFSIQPGIAASQIKLKIEGADKIEITENGSLLIKHSLGEISEEKPIAWTLDKSGNKTSVRIKFKLKDNLVSFEMPNGYNSNETLIIDPKISFSSYTGSTTDNWGCTATPDIQGNLFAGGTVFAIGYPLLGAQNVNFNGGENVGYLGFDIALSKFNDNGTAFLYSTYIGGSGNECPNSMVANNAGELYIMGTTSSANFAGSGGSSFDPVFNGGFQIVVDNELGFNETDIYVLRLNAAGNSILNFTFMGGTGNDGLNASAINNTSGGNSSNINDGDLVYNYGDCFRGEVILDNSGNVYVASSTNSTDFPKLNASQNSLKGFQDAVIFKLSANLTNLFWSTYYGGSGLDNGNSLQISAANEVYLTGGTTSTDLVVAGGQSVSYLGGAADGYLARYDAITGALIGGTYIGTNDYDQSFFVQIDINNFVYVYGQTFGAMPITAGLFGNSNAQQFIRKYSQDLSTVVWNTKVGSANERISPTAFLVSNCFEIYIAGWGGSLNTSNISGFPVTSDAFQGTTPDGDAFYIAVFDQDMAALQYATFMGGPSQEHVDGGTSRFDKNGKVYHAVCSACGGNANGFVSTPGVVSTTNNSNNCNLAAFKFELNSIDALLSAPNVIICIPNPVQFFNNSTEGDVFTWDFGDGTATSSLPNPTHVYSTVGDYNVKLVVSDSKGCKTPDSTTILVHVGSFQAGSITPPPIICKGQQYQLDAFGGLNYTWSPANVLDNPNIPNPTATIFKTTDFSVIIADTCGVDTVFVTLQVFDDSITVSPDTSICLGRAVQIEVFNAVSQIWTPNSFISNNSDNNPIVNPSTTTNYIVTATTVNNCVFKDSVLVDVFFTPPIPVLVDSIQLCKGASALINASGATSFSWSPNQRISSITGPTVTVFPLSDFTYYCDFTNACGTIRDSVFIDVIMAQIRVSNDTSICIGDTANLSVSGANSYIWSPASSLSSNISPNVMAVPSTNTNYLVVGTDLNGCKDSATVFVSIFPIHPVSLGQSILAVVGENVLLTANVNAPGQFLWLPNFNLSCNTCQKTIATPNQNITYTVIFTDTNGCKAKDLIAINYKGILYVPNTFTPDGSMFNEVFQAYGEGIVTFEMLIFDRWGELIYTMHSMDDYWDGRYKGKLCQDGTYTWKLSYTDITNELKVLTGHVNLLK